MTVEINREPRDRREMAGVGRPYQKARRQSVWEQVRGLARAYHRRWERGRK